VKTWDVNFSKRISFQEFELGPLFVILLQSRPRLFKRFFKNEPGVQNAVTAVWFQYERIIPHCLLTNSHLQLYRTELGPYFTSHPASLGLLESKQVTIARSESLS